MGVVSDCGTREFWQYKQCGVERGDERLEKKSPPGRLFFDVSQPGGIVESDIASKCSEYGKETICAWSGRQAERRATKKAEMSRSMMITGLMILRSPHRSFNSYKRYD